MDDDVRAFGVELGRKALAQDWPAVHGMLAPRMRGVYSVDDVRTFFENEYKATLEANSIQGSHYPEHSDPAVDGNSHTEGHATSSADLLCRRKGRTRSSGGDRSTT